MLARTWVVVGIIVAAAGFIVFMMTVPELREAQTLGRQLAAALDPEAARAVARLRQQYYASIASMVAGLVAAFYGLASIASRSR